jgi:hypothetical protein
MPRSWPGFPVPMFLMIESDPILAGFGGTYQRTVLPIDPADLGTINRIINARRSQSTILEQSYVRRASFQERCLSDQCPSKAFHLLQIPSQRDAISGGRSRASLDINRTAGMGYKSDGKVYIPLSSHSSIRVQC